MIVSNDCTAAIAVGRYPVTNSHSQPLAEVRLAVSISWKWSGLAGRYMRAFTEHFGSNFNLYRLLHTKTAQFDRGLDDADLLKRGAQFRDDVWQGYGLQLILFQESSPLRLLDSVGCETVTQASR